METVPHTIRRLQELQKIVNKQSCYSKIAEESKYLSEKLAKQYEDVYPEIIVELGAFITQRIKELDIEDDKAQQPSENKACDCCFSLEERAVLREMVTRVTRTILEARKEIEKQSIVDNVVPTPIAQPRPQAVQRVKRESKYLKSDEMKDKSLKEAINKLARTAEHKTLEYLSEPLNMHPTFSTIKILEINEADKRAKIEFADDKSIATIDLKEIFGFEHLE